MAEVRTLREGELRFVQASGSGKTWATAASPVSGIYGFVRSMTFTSAATINVIMNRGDTDHNKLVSKQAPNGTVNFAWTGGVPSAASGAGASVPMFHWEYRASATETPTTGTYFQFHGVTLPSLQWTEGDEDTFALSFQCLGYNGPTASGYLS